MQVNQYTFRHFACRPRSGLSFIR